MALNPSDQRKPSGFRDPAFMENRCAPIHRWVPWIAGFSGQFVEDVFKEFLPTRKRCNRSLILDPFAGVGTTLVQAMLNGHGAVGFEINPYASLATKMKLTAGRISAAKVSNLIDAIESSPGNWKGEPSKIYRPVEFRSRIPFFRLNADSCG